jgi:regulation of enolase protein 1 (concanavalin A-like superfamily)
VYFTPADEAVIFVRLANGMSIVMANLSNLAARRADGTISFIGVTADAFHFAYVPLSGNGTITARAASTDSSAQAGVMIRETLAANSNHTFSGVYGGSLWGIYRTAGGGSGYAYGGGATIPIWVRVVRSGNTFTDYTSAGGVSWTQVSSQTITMAQNVYMGLAVSGSTSTLSTATFDNISITSAGGGALPIISALSPTLRRPNAQRLHP